MAEKKQYSKIGKTYSVVSSVTVAPIRLATQDISNWTSAINSARDRINPRRRLLIELQDNIKFDGKVKTVMSKGLASILNKTFVCVSKTTKGKRIDRIHDEIINRPVFDKLLELLYLEERAYGHVAFEVVPGTEYPIDDLLMFPHANIVPETGLIIPNYMDTKNGLLFRGPDADPTCKKFVFEFGDTKNYGLLMEIAQYVIYKRGGYGDWAQFSEIFGMPFRVGKYNPTDPNSRKLLDQALRVAGGAGYAVIPEGTALEFIQTNYGSGQAGIFKEQVQACNDEIAQLWLGGTMTTEDGASKAQGEVHERGENELTAAALKRILKFLNGPWRKRLIECFGYSELNDAEFKVDSPENIPLKDRILIDKELFQMIEMDPEFLYDRYQVPPPKTGAKLKQADPQGKTKEEDGKPAASDQKKKTKLSLKLNAYYADHACGVCPPPLEGAQGEAFAPEGGFKLSFDDDVKRIAKLIFGGKLKPGSIDKALVKKTALKLIEGVLKGYKREPKDFTSADKELIGLMRENVFIFSGFKTEKMLREASALLVDDKGNVRPYNDFESKILELNTTYNKTHLAVEYNFAIAQSQMASTVLSWADLPEFPNRKYITAGDSRVRPEHAKLNGLVLAGNDPKVEEVMPVKGFGCRCEMVATDEEVNSGNYVFDASKLGPFKGNTAKTGIVFPENHPYYEASKAASERITKTAKSLM